MKMCLLTIGHHSHSRLHLGSHPLDSPLVPWLGRVYLLVQHQCYFSPQHKSRVLGAILGWGYQ